MGEYFVERPLKRPPVHPGEILREDVLPTLGLSVSEAARRLGISRQQLHRVLACTHPITYHAHRTWFDEDPSKGSKSIAIPADYNPIFRT